MRHEYNFGRQIDKQIDRQTIILQVLSILHIKIFLTHLEITGRN